MALGFVEISVGHVFRVNVIPGGASAWRIVAVAARDDGTIPTGDEAQLALAGEPAAFRKEAAQAIGAGRGHFGFADPAEGEAWASGKEEAGGYVNPRKMKN